ncbi:lipoyl synthase [Sulfurimonas microaerophilic]|uniref:lipoyl synthase n=1 Tax=Sulfurimonas microaerophilic TaxID=3058392 RepID=UPI0027144D5A|nr:lipoyl synthase [Sulfurimonas sp. hsl 1-7]
MQYTFKRKPEWLRKKINFSINKELESLLEEHNISTVCQEAMCPNISECFSKKQATFFIMGTECTRRCSFCAVDKGHPKPLDSNEPQNIAQAVKIMGLKHVVITSPTRDDLSDGGALHFCKTVQAIKELDNSIVVEILIPDLQGDSEALKKVANCGADIIAHNIETISRLYHIRKGASYNRSLDVLKMLKEYNPKIATKSGIMVGLGEKREEILELMQHLLDVGCQYFSIGQYLQPSQKHENIVEYVEPNEFEALKIIGLDMGFRYIQSSPYTRSSYMAHQYLEQQNG